MSAAVSKTSKNSGKEKKQWIITSILLIVFAFSFTKNVLLRKKSMPAASVVGSDTDDSQNLTNDLLFVTNYRLKDKQFAEQMKVWEKEWGRDPFMPQETVATIVKAVNLTLKGVLWDEKIPKAIVNDKTLLIGDTIYGYTVVDIKPKSVILKTGEKNIELQVFRAVLPDGSSIT